MSILALWLCVLLSGATPGAPRAQGEAYAQGEEEKRVETTCSQLTEALAKASVARDSAGDDPAAPDPVANALRVIRASAQVRSDKVARVLVKKGIAHRQRDLRLASAEALGTLRLESGRKALEGWLRRDRKLAEDYELMSTLLRAIAGHGKDASLPVLAELNRSGGNPQIVRARILSQARIRSKRTIESLMGSMRKVSREDLQRHMGDYRLALMVLTAVDRGTSPDAWWSWWKEQRRGFEVSDKEPRLPDRERAIWRNFWGLPREYPRPKQREERGQ